MDTRQDERYEDDDELEDLKPAKRRRRRNTEEDDAPPRKKRAYPEMVSFTVMYAFGKHNSIAEYSAPPGFTPDDIDEFILDQKDEGFKVYKVFVKKETGRGGRRRERDDD